MQNKIKICHVIGSFVNGGVESVIYNYFTHMDMSRFDVSIIGHGIEVQACADRFEKLGFHLYNITPKRVSLKKNIKEMKSIFEANQFDIVHSHLTEWACIPMILGKRCGIPVRINHSHMAEKPAGLANRFYYGIRLYLGKKYATHYFACGRDAGIYLFGRKAFDSGKVKIIPNAIDFQKFQHSDEIRTNVRAEVGLEESTTVIGHVGRFFEQKNHVFLIKIFKTYHDHNPNSVLLLFGDGVLKPEIETMVKQLGLDTCIHFMGVHTDMDRWYQAMDIFVLPSLYEGLPLVGVEAQASGLPCLFSDTITPEIRISKGADVMSLKASPEQWSAKIDEMLHNMKRENIILNSTYDISTAAKMLQLFYIRQLINIQ